MIPDFTIWCKERIGVGISTINQIELSRGYLEAFVYCRGKNPGICSRPLPPSRHESNLQIKITSYHHILAKSIFPISKWSCFVR
ncbi:Os10g0143500 [Oryza sativa Japonica Group]|uniref:Os10g0143500 protein n=1 Tax=Oryza sativa subsp. japonica TaxID=39947 RepID=A0A0P0XSB6_ORYSJ|nr:Os10g0143500 [Oryza sativa Japonica Group]